MATSLRSCKMRRNSLAVLVLMALWEGLASAQQPARKPEIGYVYPAGAQQGSVVNVVVGGQTLAGAVSALISGEGIEAEVVGYDRPLTAGEATRLRQRLEEAQKKLYPNARGLGLRRGEQMRIQELAREAGITDDQLRKLEEARRNRTDPKRQLNPQIQEQVSVKIRVSSNAQPGMRELRLHTRLGLTNPIRFFVGTLPEVAEIEPNQVLPDTAIGDRLPVVINGQITPGDLDRFVFKAARGMQLVAAVSAREIVPYLADAVPGWFQAVARITDKAGREVAYDDDWEFRPDPVLRVRIPADGEYILEIRDSIYRGREDFVYRIALGELPFLEGIFPLGVRRGATARAELVGWNLPTKTLSLDASAPGVRTVSVMPGGPRCSQTSYRVDNLPEAMEKEPNDTTRAAQRATLPIIANGRIVRPGDTDVYVIHGSKGQRIAAEIVARRLGSPLDATLTLTDAAGRRLAFADDCTDPTAGLITHQADPWFVATLPKTGAYYLRVADSQGQGGATHAYRLRVSPPEPDFDLRFTPASIALRAGQSVPVTVHVIRRDGFKGAVDLALTGAPEGFSLSGARVPEAQDSVRMTLTAAPSSEITELTRLTLEGRATIAGKTIRRTAIPADERMQAFAYTHLVAYNDCLVDVTGRAFTRPPTAFDAESPIRIPVGGTATVEIGRIAGPLVQSIVVELDEPPPGITIEKSEITGSGGTLVLRADPKKARVGDRGNLIANLFIRREAGGPARRQQASRLAPLGCLPAIPYEILRPAATADSTARKETASKR